MHQLHYGAAMSSHAAPVGVFKPSYARAPFIFALARATVLPGPCLVALMTDLAGTSSSNKALLHRMTVGGSLTMTRVGRVGTYRMSGRLLAGFSAVRGDGRLRSGSWDGRFHALIYDIPEAHRRDRDRLLMAAHQVGYRSVRPGLLISPTDEHHLLDPESKARTLTAWITFPADEIHQVVARAWRLPEFRAEYDAAIDDLTRTVATDLEQLVGAVALRTLFDAAATRTELLLREGELPDELTPPDWPAEQLRVLTQQIEQRLAPAAQAHVQAVIEASPYASLVEHGEPHP